CGRGRPPRTGGRCRSIRHGSGSGTWSSPSPLPSGGAFCAAPQGPSLPPPHPSAPGSTAGRHSPVDRCPGPAPRRTAAEHSSHVTLPVGVSHVALRWTLRQIVFPALTVQPRGGVLHEPWILCGPGDVVRVSAGSGHKIIRRGLP